MLGVTVYVLFSIEKTFRHLCVICIYSYYYNYFGINVLILYICLPISILFYHYIIFCLGL